MTSIDTTGMLPAAELPARVMASWQAAMMIPMSVTAELLRFSGRRMQAQADHLTAIAQCTSFDDALKAQSHFLQEAVAEYEAETATVAKEIQAKTLND